MCLGTSEAKNSVKSAANCRYTFWQASKQKGTIMKSITNGIGTKLGVAAVIAVLASALPALATPLTVDQTIFQNGTGVNGSGFSGTVDYTASGNTITLLLTNTSSDSAVTNSSIPAQMLLTGVGLQLPGVDITGGTVKVGSTSVGVNFSGPAGTVISSQWAYANSGTKFTGVGSLAVDTIMSSVQIGAGQHDFSGSASIGGPNYGALSKNETQFGSSQAGVKDTIEFDLTLSGTAPSYSTVNSGNVVLAFGSPDTVYRDVPDGGATVALLGLALLGLAAFRRRIARS